MAIHKARNAARKAIGTMLHDILAGIYRRDEVKVAYSPAPEQAGRRALRNTALGYLARGGRADDIALVAAHFANATNATDEVHALAILSELRSPERHQGLRCFLPALEARSPGYRQLVRLPGGTSTFRTASRPYAS